MKKEKIYFLLSLIIFASIVLAACSPDETPTESAEPTPVVPTEIPATEIPTDKPSEPLPVEKTIYVGPHLVDCQGEGPQKCMLVKDQPDEEYTLFYNQIQGFEYQEGFEYELHIREETVENPPAGGSSFRWILVEEVGRTEVGAAPLKGSLWNLESFLNQHGELVNVLQGSEITAKFEDDQVSGSAGCNQYFGAYTSEEDTLTITVIGYTEMYCEPEESMEQEGEYISALESADSYHVVGDRLEISNDNDEIILVFEAAESTTLINTPWKLNLLDDGEGKVISTIAGTEVTLVLADDGTLSGSSGCNTYNGAYEINGEQIAIGPIASTMMSCSEPNMIMEQEFAYLQMLETVTLYQIKGNGLELVNDAKGSRLSYTARLSDAAIQPVQPNAKIPTKDELKNTTYTSEWTESGFAPLLNGEYREPIAPDSATEIVILLTDQLVAGEIGTIGQAAAVILVTQPGGSGSFYDLAIVAKVNDESVNLATTLIGDRVQINAIAIENSEVVLDLIIHGPEDPMCCPTQYVIQKFALQDGELVPTSTEFLTITNILWKWEEFQEMNDNLVVVDDPELYTLEFLPDGQVNVKADCNLAGGTYIVNGSQLTIEITTTTLAVCPPDSLSDEYLRLLNDVVSYIFEDGNLFIAIKFDSGIMKFLP
jgi:heat shock protein HslJ